MDQKVKSAQFFFEIQRNAKMNTIHSQGCSHYLPTCTNCILQETSLYINCYAKVNLYEWGEMGEKKVEFPKPSA